jgi:hypothetical protein
MEIHTGGHDEESRKKLMVGLLGIHGADIRKGGLLHRSWEKSPEARL